jgi:hypothetical protein
VISPKLRQILRTTVFAACQLSLLALLAITARGEDELPRLEVSVDPTRIIVPTDTNSVKLKYTFHNVTSKKYEIVERSAFFHSFDTNWQSGIIGPIRGGQDLPALADGSWEDEALIFPEVVEDAKQSGALSSGELLLVQTFTLQAPDGSKTHVSASVVLKLGKAARVRTLKRKHFDVTVADSLFQDAENTNRLSDFLEFADAAYEQLAKVLGYVPHDGKKIPLRLVARGGTPHYQPTVGYLSIPLEVALNADESGWVWVALPHEITHYFLLEDFPNPPRWFVEGPASFFGNKVSDALHYDKITAADRKKILGWGNDYETRTKTFLFEQDWPKDSYALGLGRGYFLCTELEKLCGPDFFANLFRYLHENHIQFPREATENERMAIMLGAMQALTTEDLWAFFAREGYHP